MNIDVSDILQNEGSSLTVDCTFDSELLTNYCDFFDNVIFLKSIKIIGSFTNSGSKLNFTGSINTSFSLCCNRCLEDVCFDFSVMLDDSFVNDSCNDDLWFFNDKIIELSDYIVSNIILNFPTKVLCSDSCKGLCSVCGTNLNNSECDCDNSYSNPHFENLRLLFKQ